MSTLQQKIEERKQEAAEKRIGEMAKTVAQVLGEDKNPQRGTWRVFQDGRIRISVQEACEQHDEAYASTWTGIDVGGASVYDWSGEAILDDRARYVGIVGLTRYIPGDWERDLYALWEFALRRKDEVDRAAATTATVRTALDEEAERKNWGL